MLCATSLPLGQFAGLYKGDNWYAWLKPVLEAFECAIHRIEGRNRADVEPGNVGSRDAKPRAESERACYRGLLTRVPKEAKHHLNTRREAITVFELLPMRDG